MNWLMIILATLTILVLDFVQRLYEAEGSFNTMYLPRKNSLTSFIFLILPQLLVAAGILTVFVNFGQSMLTLSKGRGLTSPTELLRGALGFFLLFILSLILNSLVNWLRMKLGFKQVGQSIGAAIFRKQLLYFIILAASVGIIIFAWVRYTTPAVETQEQAVNLLQAKAKKLQLKNYWTKTSCLSFQSSEKDRLYYSVRVYEKHGGNCPGNPGTAPLIAYFEISKKNGEILWFDTSKSSLIPFADYAKRFSSK